MIESSKITAEHWEARCADALDVLATLPDSSVDAVITDPPYLLTGAARLQSERCEKAAYTELMNHSHWYEKWFSDCFRVLCGGGICWSSPIGVGSLRLRKRAPARK